MIEPRSETRDNNVNNFKQNMTRLTLLTISLIRLKQNMWAGQIRTPSYKRYES